MTLSGSALATQSVSPATLRQALLGKVMTVGDAVSLLPRDLGPGTSTSAASRALASSVGISWTSELLTVTGVDPERSGQRAAELAGQLGRRRPVQRRGPTAGAHEPIGVRTPEIRVDDLKGAQAQAAKLTEWLKLALDEPHLLKPWAPTPISACWCRVRPASAR